MKTSDVVREESTRQTVILIFSLVGAIASVIAIRHFQQPDVYTYYKMFWSLKLKRYAERRIAFWESISARAATAYNAEKL